jgi:hypothetical protein
MFESQPNISNSGPPAGETNVSLSEGLEEAIVKPTEGVATLVSQPQTARKLSTKRSAHGTLSSVRRVFLRTTALPMMSSYHPAIITRQSVPSHAGEKNNNL